ncbi:MAG: helix-hairpin-helix domain-containing protein [Pirellulales bacterium]|nr:helix-hairpin-helix domain-containing protein [Pirellulales bacterium]
MVDLNEAAWPELELLPEVGETTAHRIVAYRDEHGAFTSIEQLLDIDGIGPATLDKMRPYLLPLDDDPAEAASPSSK